MQVKEYVDPIAQELMGIFDTFFRAPYEQMAFEEAMLKGIADGMLARAREHGRWERLRTRWANKHQTPR